MIKKLTKDDLISNMDSALEKLNECKLGLLSILARNNNIGLTEIGKISNIVGIMDSIQIDLETRVWVFDSKEQFDAIRNFNPVKSI